MTGILMKENISDYVIEISKWKANFWIEDELYLWLVQSINWPLMSSYRV